VCVELKTDLSTPFSKEQYSEKNNSLKIVLKRTENVCCEWQQNKEKYYRNCLESCIKTDGNRNP
jgi:hypothetical protein